MHDRVQLVDRAGQPRYDLAGGEAEHLSHLVVAPNHVGHGGHVPVARLHGLHQRACSRLDAVDLLGRRALGQAERAAQARHRAGLPAPYLGRAQDGQHQVDAGLTVGRLAEDVQAVADLDVLDLTQPAVHVEEEVVELLVIGTLLQAQVLVHVRGLHEGPDLRADGRQLGRVHRGDVAVLVEQLLEPRDVAVRLRAGHGRDQVVDDRGVRAALGLRALARVVDEEGVDQRQVRDGRVRGAVSREGGVLARQPLQRAVLADVHQRVRAEAVGQPAVGGQVVVGRRELGVVVDRHRVLTEAAGRLDQQDDVARLKGGQDDLAGVVDEQGARRLAPRLDHLVAQSRGQVGGPAQVVLGGDADVALGELGRGEPLLVLAARVDEGVDEGVAGGGVGGVGLLVEELRDGSVRRAQVVAVLAHPPQEANGGRGGVQADGVADAGVLGRVRRQDQRDLAVSGRDVAQPGVGHGDPGHARAPLGVGDVAGQAVGVDLLERERSGDDAPVELGDRDLVGRVQRVDAVVRLRPVVAAPGQAQALQHGDVQGGDALDVPRLVVATRAGGPGRGAAGRQYGHDQRVQRAERVEQLVGRRAQGAGEDRHAHPAGGVDRVGQRVRESGVPAHLVGAVVEHAHAGAVRRPARAGTARRVVRPARVLPGPAPGIASFVTTRRGVRARSRRHPPHRHAHRRLEPGAGEQHGVRQKGVQLREVRGPALGEVAVGLGGGADGDRRQLHEVGVGRLLAAQHHHGHARAQDGGEPVVPRAARAKDPHHHQVGGLDQRG